MIQDTLKTRVVGIDISYNVTKFAIVDIRGNIIAQNKFLTTEHPTVNEYVSYLSDQIIELVEANGGYETIRSVGISVPSGNFLTGSIENATNLPWKGIVPLAALLRDRLSIAVALANRAHVRALGEHTFGMAHGMKDFIVITMGYGLGSCFYSNGHAHIGANGFGGEVGHSCIVEGGRLCGCGKQGCLEAYCAHKGIIANAKSVMEEFKDTPSIMRDLPELDPQIIQECCDKGDELAIEVYRRTGHILGVCLANYASILNPEAIIITGGISRAGHWLIAPTTDAFEEHVFRNIRNKVKIFASRLSYGGSSDVLGASALAWHVKEYSLFK